MTEMQALIFAIWAISAISAISVKVSDLCITSLSASTR